VIRKIKASDRHFSDLGWLQTYWLFSFDNYYDPSNVQLGALRVFNDDVVKPGKGFPTHSHREMEIVTVVLSGEITHEDSAGNKEVIRAGEVQRMTAGTGISHSEFNRGATPVHLYQIWIYPGTRGLDPGYEQRSFASARSANRLVPFASGQGMGDALTLHADATIYSSILESGNSINFETNSARRVFIYVTSGDMGVNEVRLETKDQARIEPTGNLTIEAYDDTKFILIDVPTHG
jgi:quercetin 2,3-dioxygenase